MLRDEKHSVEGLYLDTDGPIALITVDNPTEQNRLTATALTALGAIAAALRTRNDLHVVVIRGAGQEYFSTGLLNPALRGGMSKEAVIELVVQAAAAFDAIDALPQVVVAGLNGSLRAGGVELALACDIRIVADHAYLSLPEARWGGFPGAGGPLRLSRLIGRPRALELICTGREIDAHDMDKIGFAQRVVPTSDFDQELRAFAASLITARGPLAIRGAKKIMKIDEEPGFNAAQDMSLSLRRQLEWSADVDEGIRAHQEGRTPNFTGR